MEKEDLLNCKNNCKLDNKQCFETCLPKNAACRNDCIKNDLSDACFDSCQTMCGKDCSEKITTCTDNCTNIHGTLEDISVRRFIKAETISINNVEIVNRPIDADLYEYEHYGQCGDIGDKRYVCDKGTHCNTDGVCVEGPVTTDTDYYKKKFKMCDNALDSFCFENVDSRGLLRQEYKDSSGMFLKEKRFNTHLIKMLPEEKGNYENYLKEFANLSKDEQKTKEPFSYGFCGRIDGKNYVCDKESYCKGMEYTDEFGNIMIEGSCVVKKFPDIEYKYDKNRLCNDTIEIDAAKKLDSNNIRPIEDKNCFEKVQAIGKFRIDSTFDNLGFGSEQLNEDISVVNKDKCNDNKYTTYTSAINKDEECGNYKISADIYDNEELITKTFNLAKICKPNLYCAKNQEVNGGTKNICLPLKDDIINPRDSHRICRDDKDEYCYYKLDQHTDKDTLVPNDEKINKQYGFKYGCYREKSKKCDKIFKYIVSVDDNQKCGIIQTDLSATELITQQKKKLEEEKLINSNIIDESNLKLEKIEQKEDTKDTKDTKDTTDTIKEIEPKINSSIETEQKGGNQLTNLDIMMVCKKGSECRENICIPLIENPTTDNTLRFCRNEEDVNCITDVTDTIKEYKEACIKEGVKINTITKIDEIKPEQSVLSDKQKELMTKYLPEICQTKEGVELSECMASFKAESDDINYINNKTDILYLNNEDYDNTYIKTEQKCGIHYDVYKAKLNKYMVVCKKDNMCDTENKCVAISNDITNNIFRICRNEEDENCISTEFKKSNNENIFKNGTMKTKMEIINTEGKDYRIIKSLEPKPYKTTYKTPQELEESYIKCRTKTEYEYAEIVDTEKRCGFFNILHGDVSKDVAKICKTGDYCNSDSICKSITADTPKETFSMTAFRLCRNKEDTDCIRKIHDADFLHYSRVCVN